MTGVQKVSARVEELLGRTQGRRLRRAASAAEELVTLLVGLYGDGLARVDDRAGRVRDRKARR